VGVESRYNDLNSVTGCDQVSPGCAHCYAKTFAERWKGIPGHHYEQEFTKIIRGRRQR
jgi:protein gp37